MSKIETKYCKMNMDDDFFHRNLLRIQFRSNENYKINKLNRINYHIQFCFMMKLITLVYQILGIRSRVKFINHIIERFEFSKFN